MENREERENRRREEGGGDRKVCKRGDYGNGDL